MTRLSPDTLARAQGAGRFGYDRTAQATGIVHIGIGAFHRAHMAWYTDRAMTGGARDWMISGVSLRSASVQQQLQPQGGLYSVTVRNGDSAASRVIGSVRDVLVAAAQRTALTATLAAPSTRIISFTVTEKGYCRAADGTLDHDAAAQGSFYPLLADALRQRERAGCGGLTLLSCDNLADNGATLRRLMRDYLDRHDPGLAGWFDRECACPATMVDRIVPATTDADRAAVRDALGGLDDAGAVVTEPFSQWVIEDRFAGPRPPWDSVGAQLVADVAPYETAKLRMLNGAHSALAYLGLARGHAHVHEAVADPALRPMIERLMREEAAPTIAAPPDMDLDGYADALLARFANTGLPHRLSQIAMDGSQKIPQRWLATFAANHAAGRPSPVIEAALAAWVGHTRGGDGTLNDPLAPRLAALWRAHDGAGVVDALFAEQAPLIGQGLPAATRARIVAML